MTLPPCRLSALEPAPTVTAATDSAPGTQATATAVYVAYRTPWIDLDHVPHDVDVVVVHNDDAWEGPRHHDGVVHHVSAPFNVGFGAGVNLALPVVTGDRTILVNPDTRLDAEHWAALVDAAPDEVITIPLVDARGSPTSAVNRYPDAMACVLMGYRVGRLLARGGQARRLAATLLFSRGREHNRSLQMTAGRWALSRHWASAAVLSVDSKRLQSIGGFSPDYFLYMEDVDLCRRLAERYPEMVVCMPATRPAVHAVGGSAQDSTSRRAVEIHRLRSTLRYCMATRPRGWKLGSLLLRARLAVLTAAIRRQ